MESEPIVYSDLIGPHEGRELKLMLEGKKRLAWFSELDPVDMFFPHIENGNINRFEWHDYTRNLYDRVQAHTGKSHPFDVATIYYLPGEDERVSEFMETFAQIHTAVGTERERKIGELLDYPTAAIDAFIAEMQTHATKGEATILDN